MGFLDSLAKMILPPLETRAIDSFVDHPGLTEQLLAVQGLQNRPWRAASIREAMGVPAIQRAVSLISNTTGALSVAAFRNGRRMAVDDRPRIIQRPDPFSTPRDFYRDTSYNLATRGEFVWWIAARGFDGLAASLINVPLPELTIEDNPRNRAFPVYRWGKVESFRYSPATPSGDFVHGTYLKEPGTNRGMGPLQLCGAATSVSVEAQQWAANFFAGDPSTIELHSLLDLNAEEADELLDKWMEKERSNMPRVTTPSLEWKDHHVDPASAQMTDARTYQDGEAARMFGIPGSLLEYNASGSSLTYTNVEDEYIKFLRTCLTPNYLEPIEQAMTDLLTRSTVARFNVKELQRANAKARAERYEILIRAGVMLPNEARVEEELDPGDIEVSPVPFAFPAAVPARPLPDRRSEEQELAIRQAHNGERFAEAMMTLATREQPAPVVNIHPPDITLHPAPITFERGAVQVDAPDMSAMSEAIAGLAERPSPPINVDVAAPDMSGVAEALSSLSERPQPDITVNTPEIHVEPATVTFAEGSITPSFNVEPSSVSVSVPTVDTTAFAEALSDLRAEIKAPRKRKIIRDKNNVITGVTEESA